MKTVQALLFIVMAHLAGVLGSLFTVTNLGSWYDTLAKPWFQPPGWLFGPVWFVLYTLMGLAAYLVWSKGGTRTESPMVAYGVQLFFNALWSIVFFGMQETGLALLVIITLLGLIVLTMAEFWEVRKTATLLLVPYLLWVSFASFLNGAIWFLNR